MNESCSRCWHNHTHANGLECHCRCHSYGFNSTGSTYTVTCGNISNPKPEYVIYDFHQPRVMS